MKKNIIFVLLCAILSVGVLSGAAAMLDPYKTAVTVRETVLQGDPAAAKGLHITTSYHYESQAFWTADFDAGDTAADSIFRFTHSSERQQYELRYQDYQGITIDMFGGDADEQFDEKAAIYQDLVKDAVDGEEISRIVCPADYYDYYPICPNIDYPNMLVYYRGEERNKGLYQLKTAFNRAFPIPVDPDDLIEVHYEQRDGGAKRWGGSSYGDFPDLSCSSYCNENGIYFVFAPEQNGGIDLDFSGFPQGYGVYHLPITPAKNENSSAEARTDQLRNVFPLVEDTIKDAKLFGLGGRLFLITLEDDQYWATVLDMDTYEVLQKFKVCDNPEGWRISYIRGGDDHFIIHFYGDTLALIAENDAGGYHTAIHAEMPDGVYEYCSFMSWRTVSDWNGERLAIAEDTDQDGLYLAVYDKTGLLYAGLYEPSLTDQKEYLHPTSLLPAPFGTSYDPRYCLFTTNDPFNIKWN